MSILLRFSDISCYDLYLHWQLKFVDGGILMTFIDTICAAHTNTHKFHIAMFYFASLKWICGYFFSLIILGLNFALAVRLTFRFLWVLVMTLAKKIEYFIHKRSINFNDVETEWINDWNKKQNESERRIKEEYIPDLTVASGNRNMRRRKTKWEQNSAYQEVFRSLVRIELDCIQNGTLLQSFFSLFWKELKCVSVAITIYTEWFVKRRETRTTDVEACKMKT